MYPLLSFVRFDISQDSHTRPTDTKLVYFTPGITSTVCLRSLKALLAVSTAVVFVSPAYSVAFLEVLDVRTGLLDDTDTFVAEGHVGSAVVLIGTADARSGDLEKDLVVGEFGLGGLGLDDLAAL